MDAVMVILRLLHIVAGVVWAGGVFLVVSVIEPSIRASGPEGGKVMQRIAGPGRLSTYMTVAAVTAVLAGALLYWRDSEGFTSPWTTRPIGLALGLGGLAALLAFGAGGIVAGRITGRMAEVGKQLQASGGPPDPGLLAELKRLQVQMRTSTRLTAALLAIAVVAMASARYL